jgi:hypothetical protein
LRQKNHLSQYKSPSPLKNAWVGFSLTPLGIWSFAAVFAAPGEVAAEAEVSHRVVFIDLPQARSLSLLINS